MYSNQNNFTNVITENKLQNSNSPTFDYNSTNKQENYIYNISNSNNLPSYQPPPYEAPQNQQSQPQLSREELYKRIVTKYEISQEYSARLQKLTGCKIVFIFDDSSSMNTVLNESPLNDMNRDRLLKATRWEELQYFASISIEIANLFNDSTDVYFLNKPPIRNINNIDFLLNFLKQNKPNGYTPLNKIFNQVLNENVNYIREKKLLIIILTDGEPTDDYGNGDIKNFKRSLLSRDPMNKIFVNIVTCTDDDDSVHYLNKWDRTIKNLDVIDDYKSEKDEVKKAKGQRYHFSFGDYVVKALVGSLGIFF